MEKSRIQQQFVRLLFMVLFWIFLRISLAVTALIALIIWVRHWFSSEPLAKLTEFAGSLRLFQAQILAYLTFASDDKVFPFAQWPTDN